MEKIEIKRSNKKTLLTILIGIAFTSLSVWFILYPDNFAGSDRTPETVFLVGIAGALFFGSGSILMIIILFKNPLRLTIDDNGITDNNSASPIKFIAWADIMAIKKEKIYSNYFLLIHVRRPQEYIDKAKGYGKSTMKWNNRLYGTPLTISSVGLNCTFKELEKMVLEGLEESRRRDSPAENMEK